MTHPALAAGKAAVITGAASGIGLAVARRLAVLGMKLCLADRDAGALEHAAAGIDAEHLLLVPTDVADPAAVIALKERAYAAFGTVAFLMNNAAIDDGGPVLGDPAKWRRLLDVNLMGVLNGIQSFAPAMVAQGTPAAIVNTGSKQGITTPPGNAAYNTSKAGVKVVTEALAYELRQTSGCQVTAHLLIPGWTFTGLSRADTKPEGAWTADQVAAFMDEGMARGDFYLLCPDNLVTRAMDERRMAWAMGDIIHNRPALSRWHPDYAAAFDDFMKQ